METMKLDNQQATPYELGWLVAIIEGEGSVGLYWNSARKQLQVRLTITNTDKALIDYAAEIIRKVGVNPFIYDHNRKRQQPNWKQRYDIHVEGIKRNRAFLATLLPHWYPETVKRRRAAICLGFCESRLSHPKFHGRGGRTKYTTGEIAMYSRIKQLNGESSETMSIPVIEVTEDIVQLQ